MGKGSLLFLLDRDARLDIVLSPQQTKREKKYLDNNFMRHATSSPHCKVYYFYSK